MATIWNPNSQYVVRMYRIWCFNWQTSAATGVLVEHELRRITNRTATTGTAVVPDPDDEANPMPAGIVIETNSAGITDGRLLRRFYGTNEEVLIGALTFQNVMNDENGIGSLVYSAMPGRAKLIRGGAGITVKCVTSTTVPSLSYVIEYGIAPSNDGGNTY